MRWFNSRLSILYPFALLWIFAWAPVLDAATKPNIVFILADDLNEEIFSHSSRIHALVGSKGLSFDQHFVSLSQCCPSRVSILRGQYAHNSGIFSNEGENGGFVAAHKKGLEQSTLATWLQAAGYRTALMGKYLNAYPYSVDINYIPPGWDYWVCANGGGPYTGYNYSLNDNGVTVNYGSGDQDFLVDVLSNKAAAFIRNTVADFPGKPFLLFVTPYAPHVPAAAPTRYLQDFPGAQAPRTASFNEADVRDKPAWIRDGLPLLSAAQILAIDDLYRKNLQSMEAVEDLVENVVNALQETGQLSNTYIFFTSDNGFHQGQHRFDSGKNTVYQEDISVPLEVRGPGVPEGQAVNRITANVDFAPTFAQLAGVTPPDFVDGRSLVPFLQGTMPTTWRRGLLLEHAGYSPPTALSAIDGTLEPPDAFDRGKYAVVRLEQPIFAGILGINSIKYVEYSNGEREIYNLIKDPGEMVNRYGVAAQTMRIRMNAWLNALRTASGQQLRDIELAMPPLP